MMDPLHEIRAAAPGTVGAAIMVAFTRFEKPWQWLIALVAGAVLAYLLRSEAAAIFGIDPNVAAAGLGIFGIPVARAAITLIERLDLVKLLRDVLIARGLLKDKDRT
jgi:hypothetical protein